MSAIPGYVEIREIAKRFRVHYSQAAKYVQHGHLPHILVGNVKLVPIEAVDKFTPRPVGNPDFQKKPKGRKKAV